jgi:hypothetical protein
VIQLRSMFPARNPAQDAGYARAGRSADTGRAPCSARFLDPAIRDSLSWLISNADSRRVDTPCSWNGRPDEPHLSPATELVASPHFGLYELGYAAIASLGSSAE